MKKDWVPVAGLYLNIDKDGNESMCGKSIDGQIFCVVKNDRKSANDSFPDFKLIKKMDDLSNLKINIKK